MTRIYIAAPLPLLAHAQELAAYLRRTHEVVSTWHDGSPTVAEDTALSSAEAAALARRCVSEVLSCDTLVLLYGPETTRHGSVFEAGIALGAGKRVVALNTGADAVLPTVLLHHSLVWPGALELPIGWALWGWL